MKYYVLHHGMYAANIVSGRTKTFMYDLTQILAVNTLKCSEILHE